VDEYLVSPLMLNQVQWQLPMMDVGYYFTLRKVEVMPGQMNMFHDEVKDARN
jgi:hypothetical protein